MGYSTTSVSGIKYYSPSDDQLITNDTQTLCDYGTPTKIKEFELVRLIDTNSKFRYKMELKSGAAGANHCYGQIYRNGVAVGALNDDNTGAFQWFTEDLSETNWVVGDKIQLYVYKSGAIFSYNRAFQICGVGSEWRAV